MTATNTKFNHATKHGVTVICYGKSNHFDTKEEAIRKYTEYMNGCDEDSSERHRYELIVNRLQCGFTQVTDED